MSIYLHVVLFTVPSGIVVWQNTTFVKIAESRLALKRFAPDRFAEFRFAPLRYVTSGNSDLKSVSARFA